VLTAHYYSTILPIQFTTKFSAQATMASAFQKLLTSTEVASSLWQPHPFLEAAASLASEWTRDFIIIPY
jgi:hypothetical protein